MNELSGVSLDAIAACAEGPIRNQGQTLALDRIDSVYKRIPPPPSSLSPAGAFRELCGTASRYKPCDATNTAPYDKELISWPPVGTVPVSTIGSLEGADRHLIEGWEQHVLEGADARKKYSNSFCRPKPFLDPTLTRRSLVYAVF